MNTNVILQYGFFFACSKKTFRQIIDVMQLPMRLYHVRSVLFFCVSISFDFPKCYRTVDRQLEHDTKKQIQKSIQISSIMLYRGYHVVFVNIITAVIIIHANTEPILFPQTHMIIHMMIIQIQNEYYRICTPSVCGKKKTC